MHSEQLEERHLLLANSLSDEDILPKYVRDEKYSILFSLQF
jgi:hypothetical protein